MAVEQSTGTEQAFVTPPEVLRPVATPRVVMPTAINLDWPEQPVGDSLVELLERPLTQPGPGPLFGAFRWLLPALAEWHQQGASMLAPWSLRMLEDSIAVWGAPGFGSTVSWPDQLRLVSSHGPSADLHALGLLLYRMAAGHWAESSVRAVEVAGILSGEWSPGVALAITCCLHPDPGRRTNTASELLVRLDPFLGQEGRPELPPGTKIQVADESVTGWTKTRGRPGGDNEDASAWNWTSDGIVAAVLDGVSGAGDGGGRWASGELRRRLRAQWHRRMWEPSAVLAEAAASMSPPPRTVASRSCTVATVIRVSSTRLDWASVGDCRLYLARPRSNGVSVVRLSAEHSLMAANLRSGRPSRADEADVVTSALPEPNRGIWSGSIQLYLGDIVLLVSDGACAVPGDDTGIEDWRFCDVLEDLLNLPEHPHAPLLVSQLCRRAEDLGGEDNATALAAVCGPVPAALLRRVARRRSTVGDEPGPMIISE